MRSVSSQNRTNVLSLPGITRTLITNHFLHSIYGSVLSKNSVKSVNSVKRPQGTGNPHQGRQGRGSRAGERTSLQHANSHTPARSMRLMDLCLPPPLALRLGERSKIPLREWGMKGVGFEKIAVLPGSRPEPGLRKDGIL